MSHTAHGKRQIHVRQLRKNFTWGVWGNTVLFVGSLKLDKYLVPAMLKKDERCHDDFNDDNYDDDGKCDSDPDDDDDDDNDCKADDTENDTAVDDDDDGNHRYRDDNLKFSYMYVHVPVVVVQSCIKNSFSFWLAIGQNCLLPWLLY